MKKLIFLLFTSLSFFAQNPTRFDKVRITANVQDNTATKINVQSADNQVNWITKANFIGEVLASMPPITLQNTIINDPYAIGEFSISNSVADFNNVYGASFGIQGSTATMAALFSPSNTALNIYNEVNATKDYIELIRYQNSGGASPFKINKKKLIINDDGIGFQTTATTNIDWIAYLKTDDLTSDVVLQAPTSGGTIATEEWANATFTGGGGSQDLDTTLTNGNITTQSIGITGGSVYVESATTGNYISLNNDRIEINNANNFNAQIQADDLTDNHLHQLPDDSGTFVIAVNGNYAGVDGHINFTLFDGEYSSLTGVPSTFTPSSHSHVIGDVTNLQTTIDNKVADFINDAATTIAPSQNAVFDALALKANDYGVVHKTGNENITGIKEFSNEPLFSGGSIKISTGASDNATLGYSFGTGIELKENGSILLSVGDGITAFSKSTGDSMAFDFTSVTSGKTATWQNSNGTVAWTSQIPNFDENNIVQYCEFITAATTANPPFIGAAISTGTNAANTTNLNSNRPGVVRMTSSTTANGGYKWQTDVTTTRLGGNEIFTTGIAPLNFTTTTMYAGFHDSATSALPVDGVYFKYSQNGNIVLETSNNSTRSTSGTITTLSLNTWYKLKITMNSDATSALGEVFDATGTLIRSETLTTNIPKTAGREVGSGIVVTESTTTATAMLDLDYIKTQFKVVR